MLQPRYTLTSSEVIIKELLSKSLSPTEMQRLSFVREYIDPTRGHALLRGAAGELLAVRCALHTLSGTFSHYFLESKGFLGTHFYKRFQNPPDIKGDWQLLRCTCPGSGHTSKFCLIITLWTGLKIRDTEGTKSLTSAVEYLCRLGRPPTFSRGDVFQRKPSASS